MTGGDFGTAVIAGVAVVVVCLVGAFQRERQLPGLDPDRPRVGRSAEDIAQGPPAAFRHIRATTPEQREAVRLQRVFASFDQRFGDEGWPTSWAQIVLHPLAGDPPPSTAEEGPPWHFVIHADATLEATSRLLRGRPGAPPGLPPATAIHGVHVVLPLATRVTPARRQALRDLSAWIRHRLGKEIAVVFASKQPGATVPLPAGVSKEDWIPVR
jgi:hypothetical protein